MFTHFQQICVFHTLWSEVAVRIFLAFCGALFMYVAFRYMRLKSPHDGLRLFGEVCCRPASCAIGVYALLGALQVLLCAYPFYMSCLTIVRHTGLALTFAYLFFKWQEKYQACLLKKNTSASHRMLIDTLGKIGTVLVIFLVGAVVLQILGIPLQGVLAIGGIGGLAMSWAAKDVIANFFGGFMILVNQPFVVGDWIRSRNRNFEGQVSRIGWYHTIMLSGDGRPVSIPNALMTDAMIENAGPNYAHRIKKLLNISLSDVGSIEEITVSIKGYFDTHERLDQRQTNRAVLVDIGPASLHLVVTCYVKPMSKQEFFAVQQSILLTIAEIIKKHGATLAVIIS